MPGGMRGRGGEGPGPFGPKILGDLRKDLAAEEPDVVQVRDVVEVEVVLTAVAEPVAGLGLPEAGDDLELLGQPVEALAQRRERDAEEAVLALVPGGADAEFGPAAAHRVHRGHGDRERSRAA